MRPHALWIPIALGLAASCNPDDKSSGSEEGSTLATDDSTPTTHAMCGVPGPTIEVTNETSLSLTALRYRPCDGSTPDEKFPFPGGELGEAASFPVELPAPGCYSLSIVEPSGCFVDPRVETGELDACDKFSFAVTWELLACPGGLAQEP